MNKNLEGKVAVITGGGGILGSSMAKVLAGAGAYVAVIGRSIEPLVKVEKEIEDRGGICLPIQADVTDRKSLEAARDIIERKLGACCILVNAAGGNNPSATTEREFFLNEEAASIDASGKASDFFNLDSNSLHFVFGLNFFETVLACQVFGKSMAGKGGCSIINISSMSAERPLTKVPAYSAAKAAIDNFTRWLAVHLSKEGIRVNAISPGFFLTEQNRPLLMNMDGSLTQRAEKIIAHTPFGRFGRPEDLAGTLLWLASSELSGFVTGVVIPVDGGFSAYTGI